MIQNATGRGCAPQRRVKLSALGFHAAPVATGLASFLAVLVLTTFDASAQTFNGTDVTSGPFYSGTQYFNHGSRLNASSPWAIGGGTQEFRQLSRLDASAANAVGGGNQYFYDSSSLNASARNAVSYGTQTFFDTSTLNASAANAISGGTQTFSGASRLNVSASNAVSGGSELRFGGFSQLYITAANGVGGVTASLRDYSTLTALAAKATSSANLLDNSKLIAAAANAVDGGIFRFSDASMLNATAANAVSGGTLVFSKSAILNASVTNAISGGLIVLQDTATAQVRAANALTNGVDFDLRHKSALVLNGYSTVVGRVMADESAQIRNGGSSDATLTLDTSMFGESVIRAAMVDGGFGKLNFVKTGAGLVQLYGDKTYTGSTVVNGGTLAVRGSINGSALTVASGGTLSGDGTVGTTTIASGGTLAPLASGSTLKVAGDLTYSPGSFHRVETTPYATSGSVAVTGTAYLNGASVVFGRAPFARDEYGLTQTYTILTAGSISGAFSGVSEKFAFLDATLAYSPTDVKLTLQRNDMSFAGVGQTQNQDAAALASEVLGANNPLFGEILGLDAASARAAFDALSGEIHASANTALIEDSRFVRDAINERVRAAFEAVGAKKAPVLAYGETGNGNAAIAPTLAPADTERLATWGSVFGSWGGTDGTSNAAKLNRATGGFVTGLDGVVARNVRLGIIAGYSHDNFHVDDRASWGSSDNYHLGLYGGTQMGALGLRAGAVYSWSRVDTTRSVAFPGFAENLSADYEAGTAQAFGELGYRTDGAGASFEPFANLAYVNVHTGGFTELGGAAALTSTSRTTGVTFITLGTRASAGFDLGTVRATARGMLGWRHAFGDTTPLATHAFAGGDVPFTIAGVPIARDSAAIEAGLDFAVSSNATLGISYSGQFGSRAHDNGATANFTLRF